jgi:Tfp pilus assembly protein PilN
MIDINLVAERQRQRRTTERFARASLVIVMIFLVATVGVFTARQVTVSKGRAEIRKLANEVAGWQDQKRDVDALRKQLEHKEPLVRLLNEARDSERFWCTVLRDISLAVPEEGVSLRAMASSSSINLRVKAEGSTGATPSVRGVSIDGTAVQWEDIGKFMTNLNETSAFTETWLTATTLQPGGAGVAPSYRFEIIAVLAVSAQGVDAA